eukprot:1065797-Alexandrium_andersonii.AAC.1
MTQRSTPRLARWQPLAPRAPCACSLRTPLFSSPNALHARGARPSQKPVPLSRAFRHSVSALLFTRSPLPAARSPLEAP